ncbi:MAG: hypothetical protein V4556_09770 [Bacteroidota bacterium]
MRKFFLLLMMACLMQTFVFAQVGIGTTSPNANAALDIASTDKGLIIPRVTTVKRLQMSNTAGLLVYDTNDNAYWCNNGSGWSRIASLPPATNAGDILYWNGTSWAILPIGLKGQVLRVCDGALTWNACTPSVATSAISNINSSSATSGGVITNDGGATVTAVGVCYATTPLPTLINSFTSNFPAGVFTSNISGLTPATQYYVRAYATNSQGTSYGNQEVFTTASGTPITLSTSPFTLDFNGTNPVLPAGVSIRTGASASNLGNEAIFNNANNYHWATPSSAARSYASGTLPSSTDSAGQAAATERAIGYRQTSGSGDPGTAFVFKIANTTSKSNFILGFSLQSLDVTSTRTVTWYVDYALGDAPTFFTSVSTGGTMTTGGSTFASNLVTTDFGSLLNNKSQTVWIRIIALSNSTGSGTRPTTAIDNVSLTWQ